MDRGGWRATVHGVTKEADATEGLKNTSAKQSGWLQTRELPLPQGQWGHRAVRLATDA